jgi:VWFA-related protein
MRKEVSIVQLLVVLALLLATGTGQAWAQAGGGKVSGGSVDDQNFPAMKAVVTVVDVNGIPFTGLTAGDFSVFEDGKSIAVTTSEQVNPAVSVSLLLAIDKSGSMAAKSATNPGKTKLDDAKDAAVRFLEKLGATDRAGILAFGDQVDLNLPLDDDCVSDTITKEHAFTDDKGALINCVNSLDTVANVVTTPLYDAAYKSVIETAREAAARQNTPVVILFTDGKEEGLRGQPASKNPRVSAELAARQEHIAIFTIALGADADTAYLKALAESTGGQFYEAPDPTKLKEIYDDVANRLRTQYNLSWQSKIQADAATHQLDVKVTVGGKEMGNRFPFVALKPVIPGIRFMHKHPTGLFNLGRETEIQPLTAGLDFYSDWTIVPDISARYDIERVEYYLNDEAQPAFIAEAFPFNLPWAATRRGVPKEGATFTVRAVAYDKEGHQGEQTISLNLKRGGVDIFWLVLIIALILLIAVVVLIFALRQQRQVELAQPVPAPGIPSTVRPGLPPATPTPSPTPQAFPERPERGPGGTVPAPPPTAVPSRPTPVAWLLVTGGPEQGREFQLTRPETHIGREGDNDIVLEDPAVSRRHVSIRLEGGQYHLYDLGALNPAKVNGRQVSRCRLEDGDEILLGHTTLTFKLVAS